MYSRIIANKITRVQSLSMSGIGKIPREYVIDPKLRPSSSLPLTGQPFKVKVIDYADLLSDNPHVRDATLLALRKACEEGGFFQLVNHGVCMEKIRKECRDFFNLPQEEKELLANSRFIEEGYGSKLGVAKGAKPDWSDHIFLHLLPSYVRDREKWAQLPSTLRNVIEEYHQELFEVVGCLLRALSASLGLEENKLSQVLGGEKIGAFMRVNYYPKCPEPDLTLGLSAHSDPGALTLLLADDKVSGLQVLKDGTWFTVDPLPNALIVNIGDQIQVLSNGYYKSSEHRATVNSVAERMSIACFYNPNGDEIIEPIKELITEKAPALYSPRTFDEHIAILAQNGLSGKLQVESLKISDVA